jgi:hypothetical protein
MQRVRAGRATLLVKVNSHRGEPINERGDTTFEVRKGNKTVYSIWINSGHNGVEVGGA